jgi:hypothetical protein
MDESRATPPTHASDVVAERVNDLRKRGGWTTAKAFAERCAEVGAPYLTAPALMNIESGRRKDGHRTRTLTVDELLALAVALRVNPVDLLVPADSNEDPYPVTSTETATVARVRDWIGGQGFLVEPQNAAELADSLRTLPSERAAALNGTWWTRERQMEHTRANNRAFPPVLPDDPDERQRKTDPLAWLAAREARAAHNGEGDESGSDDGTETT